MNIKGENRGKILDKNKRRYAPARALPLIDREDSKTEQRRLAKLVKDARRGKVYVSIVQERIAS